MRYVVNGEALKGVTDLLTGMTLKADGEALRGNGKVLKVDGDALKGGR